MRIVPQILSQEIKISLFVIGVSIRNYFDFSRLPASENR
jgi:hypothetical protein